MTAVDAHLFVYEADRRYVRFLNRIDRPDQGVVAVRIRPDMRRENWLYRDILAALGKQPDVQGTTQLTALSDITTAAWLKAHRIHTLVVLDAGSPSRNILENVLRFAGALELDLWLGVELHITQAVEDALTGRQIDVVDRKTFDRTFAVADVKVPAGDDEARAYPAEVPASSYPCFLEDVDRYLTPEDARQVHNRHEHVYASMIGQLGGDPTADQIRRLARQAVNSAHTRAELITALRAFQQVVADRPGIHVSFHERRLTGDQSIVGRRTAADRDTWRRIRAYRQPYRGAAAAAHAAGIPLAELPALEIGDVGDTHISHAGRTHPLHPGSELFCQALVWERRLSGAGDSDKLFVAPSGRPYDIRRLADAIAVLRTEIGVNLYGHELARRPATDSQWARRHINSITSLRRTA